MKNIKKVIVVFLVLFMAQISFGQKAKFLNQKTEGQTNTINLTKYDTNKALVIVFSEKMDGKNSLQIFGSNRSTKSGFNLFVYNDKKETIYSNTITLHKANVLSYLSPILTLENQCENIRVEIKPIKPNAHIYGDIGINLN